MAKRRKVKQPQQPVIGHLQAKTVLMEVDDPYFNSAHFGASGNTKRTKALFNMNESVSAHWYAKNMIDDAEMAAATRFRHIWEVASGALGGGIDYERIKVDTFGVQDPIATNRAEAVLELRNASHVLGPAGYDLVCTLCGECRRLSDVSPNRTVQDKKSYLCREMLGILAEYWGYKTRTRKAG